MGNNSGPGHAAGSNPKSHAGGANPARPRHYRGRFAPSPTGDLHFGSLIAAVGSYCQARHEGGTWLIRMEDLDPPREVPGSADAILKQLAALGMHSDEPVLYQSTRSERYQQTIDQLLELDAAFYCGCTRKQLPANGIYPGTCASGLPESVAPRSIRFRASADPISFMDKLQGSVSESVADQVGDFIIRRADGLTAYQLAVVIDDADQQVTEIVRGVDLLDSTARQIDIQRRLGLPTPAYVHLPLAVSADGIKLSKRAFADPVDLHQPVETLTAAWQFLGQIQPPPLAGPDEFWRWAIKHWVLERVPRDNQIV